MCFWKVWGFLTPFIVYLIVSCLIDFFSHFFCVWFQTDECSAKSIEDWEIAKNTFNADLPSICEYRLIHLTRNEFPTNMASTTCTLQNLPLVSWKPSILTGGLCNFHIVHECTSRQHTEGLAVAIHKHTLASISSKQVQSLVRQEAIQFDSTLTPNYGS